MRHALVKVAVAVGLALLPIPPQTHAANPASDDAADPAYDDGWQTDDNGGYGFGPWFMELSGTGGKRLASSTLNGDTNGDGDIDTAGRSWLLSAGDNGDAQAFRNFTGGTLMPGESFGFTGDYTPPADPNALFSAGAGLGNTLGEARIFVGLETGTSNYFVDDADGIRSTGVTPTSDGLRFDFMLNTLDTYTLRLTQLGTGEISTFTGELAGTPGSRLNHFGMFAYYSSGYSSQDSFFNSLEVIVPEPAIPTAAALLLLSLTRARRRRNPRSAK